MLSYAHIPHYNYQDIDQNVSNLGHPSTPCQCELPRCSPYILAAALSACLRYPLSDLWLRRWAPEKIKESNERSFSFNS
jgi:hypothetical protein